MKEVRSGSDYVIVVNWYHPYFFRSSRLGSMWRKTIFHIQRNSRTTQMSGEKRIVLCYFWILRFLWSRPSGKSAPKEKMKWTIRIISVCPICLLLRGYLKYPSVHLWLMTILGEENVRSLVKNVLSFRNSKANTFNVAVKFDQLWNVIYYGNLHIAYNSILTSA